MKGFLTSRERKHLIAEHKRERDKRVCDRIKAVLLRDKGYSYQQIAAILLLDDATIRRHVKDYEKKKLKPENGGSNSQLSESESSELIAHLDATTYLYIKDICGYVRDRYKKQYSISGMRKWLQTHNFRYKKPHRVPAKADKSQQDEFIASYQKLKKSARNKEPIYFADSVHPQHQTCLAYGWILKGKRKAIATTARQKRVNYIGAYSLKGHKLVYSKVDKVDAERIKAFMNKLRKRHPGSRVIHMIWDNAGYHRSREVQDIAKELNIALHYLPPYSPNLNPIERLWKIMHEKVRYNHYYATFLEFSEAIAKFFRHIGKSKTILRSRITDNFQTLESPNFAS